MARFHTNPTTGDVSVCKAAAGNCPFKSEDGGESTHYSSAEEARNAYEKKQVVFAAPAASLSFPVDEGAAPLSMSGEGTIDRTFPESAWLAHETKWREQGLGAVSDSLAAVKTFAPGTPEHTQAFQKFTVSFSQAADVQKVAYGEATRALIAAREDFRMAHYQAAPAAEQSKAAYAYLDSYSASTQVNEVSESFTELKEQAHKQLRGAEAPVREAYAALEAQEEKRWADAPGLPAWERAALEATELSSTKLLRYQHLGGGFVQRYEEALAAEKPASKGFFSRFRRPSITSVE